MQTVLMNPETANSGPPEMSQDEGFAYRNIMTQCGMSKDAQALIALTDYLADQLREFKKKYSRNSIAEALQTGGFDGEHRCARRAAAELLRIAAGGAWAVEQISGSLAGAAY